MFSYMVPHTLNSPLVIKIGSAVLADSAGHIDPKVISNIVSDVAYLHSQGLKVCIVSSGAIGAGMAALKQARKPRLLKKKQGADLL